MARIVIITALIAIQTIFGTPTFLLEPGGYWIRALSYSFFHAGWLHLAINCIAVWGMFKPGRISLGKFICAYAIGFIVYPLSLRPVIGFSNILYALIGLRTPPLKSKWWRSTQVIIFLVVTVAMVAIPRFSATTHIAAFLLGCAVAGTERFIKSVNRDAGRYY